MNHYLGIDPGKSGGIALVDASGLLIETHKMPETDRDLWELLSHLKNTMEIRSAIIEQLQPLPSFVAEKMGIQRGSVATWKLGVHYGKLLMALTCAEIRTETKTPQKWQGLMDCMTHGDKNISKEKAQRLWPGAHLTHATADASLIAECCRRLDQGIIVERRTRKKEPTQLSLSDSAGAA